MSECSNDKESLKMAVSIFISYKKIIFLSEIVDDSRSSFIQAETLHLLNIYILFKSMFFYQ